MRVATTPQANTGACKIIPSIGLPNQEKRVILDPDRNGQRVALHTQPQGAGATPSQLDRRTFVSLERHPGEETR